VQPSQDRFDFLLNFTGASGLNEAYNYKSALGESISVGAPFEDVPCEAFPFNEFLVSNPFDCYLGDIEASLWEDFEDVKQVSGKPTGYTLLSEKANQISQTLHPISDKASQCFETPVDLLEFFSPENIERFLDLFWSRWYRHCPIIHKASFDLEDCSIILLAIMSLVGACMSARKSDHLEAKRILNSAEEILFANPLFSETVISVPERSTYLDTTQNVQILQAACFMCLLQKWEGDKAAKLRMQRHRFTAIVAVRCPYLKFEVKEDLTRIQATRAMGLSHSIHHRPSFSLQPTLEEWREYMVKEQLIR
jgi:hypothetical protein